LFHLGHGFVLKKNYFKEFQTKAAAIDQHANNFYFISDVVLC